MLHNIKNAMKSPYSSFTHRGWRRYNSLLFNVDPSSSDPINRSKDVKDISCGNRQEIISSEYMHAEI